MGFARDRALTHGRMLTPIFGYIGRNGIRPRQGIDTLLPLQKQQQLLLVEMGFARDRALTQAMTTIWHATEVVEMGFAR